MGIRGWRGIVMTALATVGWCGSASSASAQCHPTLLDNAQPAGPGHVTTQLLRYDSDGEGPQGAMLVSVGAGRPGINPAIRAYDAIANQWFTIGESSMTSGNAAAATAFGADAEGDGPYLAAVTNGIQGLADAPATGNALVVFDGAQWSVVAASVPTGTCRAVCPFDPDGPGPHARTFAIDMRTQGGTQREVFALVNGDWIRLGDAWPATSTTNPPVHPMFTWDPDGPDGEQPDSLYIFGGLRWNGAEWESTGVTGTVSQMRLLDLDGDGPERPRLAFIGSCRAPGGTGNWPIVLFDGQAWSTLSNVGVRGNPTDAFVTSSGEVRMVTSSSSSWRAGEYRLEGGAWVAIVDIYSAQSLVNVVITAEWAPNVDGIERAYVYPVVNGSGIQAWIGEMRPPPSPQREPLYLPSPGRGFNGMAYDATALADGGAVVSGDFTSVDGELMPRIARRDAEGRWHRMGFRGAWLSRPRNMIELSDGRILAIDQGSEDANGTVWQFDGESWTSFLDLGTPISARRIYRSEGDVLTFVNPAWTVADTWTARCGVAQWRDGILTPADLNTVPTQYDIAVAPNGDIVRSLDPDPTRPETATGLMRWNGTEWMAMGVGSCRASNLRFMPDGTLTGLVVVSGQGRRRIFRWNGASWVADPVNGPMIPGTITSFDVLGQDDIMAFGGCSILEGGSYQYRPIARVVDTYWADPIGGGYMAHPSLQKKAVGLANGNALVLGYFGVDPDTRSPSHFGVYEVMACDPCPVCPADWDWSGGVDGADVAAFFVDYEQGNRCADVDDSAGVDATDMAIFFQAYEAGGC